jgi:hypothetical protein
MEVTDIVTVFQLQFLETFTLDAANFNTTYSNAIFEDINSFLFGINGCSGIKFELNVPSSTRFSLPTSHFSDGSLPIQLNFRRISPSRNKINLNLDSHGLYGLDTVP